MKVLLSLFLSIGFSIGLFAQEQKIEWLSFETAVQRIAEDKDNEKKIFIDVYTDWCGWCKKMDKETFNDPEVRAYMIKNFYMVKFNAEQTEDVIFQGQTYSFVPQGKKGYHELAVALTNGKLSYPTVVYLTSKFEMLAPVAGYYPAAPFLTVAKYFGDDIFKDMTWKDYEASQSK